MIALGIADTVLTFIALAGCGADLVMEPALVAVAQGAAHIGLLRNPGAIVSEVCSSKAEARRISASECPASTRTATTVPTQAICR